MANKGKSLILLSLIILVFNIENFYLPPYDECSIEFLFDVMTGRKRALPKKDLNIHKMPRYEEFKTEALIKIASEDLSVRSYLPEE